MEFCNYLPQETKELRQRWLNLSQNAGFYFLDAVLHRPKGAESLEAKF